MIDQQLSILLVVLPLLSAPITAMLNRATAAWFITLIVTGLCFIMSVMMLIDVSTGTVIHYELGGWAPPDSFRKLGSSKVVRH